jgi:hypothetical protein
MPAECRWPRDRPEPPTRAPGASRRQPRPGSPHGGDPGADRLTGHQSPAGGPGPPAPADRAGAGAAPAGADSHQTGPCPRTAGRAPGQCKGAVSSSTSRPRIFRTAEASICIIRCFVTPKDAAIVGWVLPSRRPTRITRSGAVSASSAARNRGQVRHARTSCEVQRALRRRGVDGPGRRGRGPGGGHARVGDQLRRDGHRAAQRRARGRPIEGPSRGPPSARGRRSGALGPASGILGVLGVLGHGHGARLGSDQPFDGAAGPWQRVGRKSAQPGVIAFRRLQEGLARGLEHVVVIKAAPRQLAVRLARQVGQAEMFFDFDGGGGGREGVFGHFLLFSR